MTIFFRQAGSHSVVQVNTTEDRPTNLDAKCFHN